jgi:glyoxylase-like metal-dependent hydrolase (beta-lactamase superfamily II)
LGLVCGNKYSLVIDSGISPKHAAEFLEDCRSLGGSPLKYLILTHHHYDHVLGTSEMNLLTITHEKIEEELKRMRSYRWDDISLAQNVEQGIIPQFGADCIKAENEDREQLRIGEVDMTFSNSVTIDLGGITCDIEVIDNCHVDGSVTIYVPEEKVLFLGDCIYGRRYNGIYGYHKETYEKLKEVVSSYDAEYYIISHEEVQDRKMMKELWAEIEKEAVFF